MVTSTYDLGAASGAFTGVANREDLLDVITMISPTETPCFTKFRKTKTSNVATEWLIDALATAADNTVAEGSSATEDTAQVRVRMINYHQISRKTYDVSETQRAVNPAGVKDEFAYQMGKALKELKRDIEYGIVNNSATFTGTEATGRTARGIYGFINTYSNNFVSSNSGYTGSNASSCEPELNDLLQAIWNDGGEPDWVITTAFYKGLISRHWAGTQSLDRMMPSDGTQLTSVIDVYRSDFGTVKMIPHRFLADPAARTMSVMESGKWMVGLLRPIKNTPLAKVGSSDKAMVEAEWTLICLHPSANGMITDVPTSNS